MRKNKLLITFIAIAMVVLPITATADSYTFNDSDAIIKINGVELTCLPMKLYNNTYLPVRDVAEELNAEVSYNAETKEINISTVDINELAKSCVMLQVSGGQGSGVYVDYGKILTCDHVTRGMTSYKTSEGLNLTLDKGNKEIDASVLNSPDNNVKPVKIGDSDELKQDDKVILISSPKGNKNIITYGLMMEECKEGQKETLIWIDAEPGSSGGAVFNMKGELIGITNTAAKKDVNDARCCSMIPVNEIRKQL